MLDLLSLRTNRTRDLWPVSDAGLDTERSRNWLRTVKENGVVRSSDEVQLDSVADDPANSTFDRSLNDAAQFIKDDRRPFKPNIKDKDLKAEKESLTNTQEYIYVNKLDPQLKKPITRAGLEENPRRRNIFLQGPKGARPIDLILERTKEKYRKEKTKDLSEQSNIVIICDNEASCQDAASKLVRLSEVQDRKELVSNIEVLAGQSLESIQHQTEKPGTKIYFISKSSVGSTIQLYTKKHAQESSTNRMANALQALFHYVGLDRTGENKTDYLYFESAHDYTTDTGQALLKNFESGLQIDTRTDDDPAEIIGVSHSSTGHQLDVNTPITLDTIFTQRIYMPPPSELAAIGELPILVGLVKATNAGERTTIETENGKSKSIDTSLAASTRTQGFCEEILAEFDQEIANNPGRFNTNSIEIRMPDYKSCAAMIKALKGHTVGFAYDKHLKFIDNNGEEHSLKNKTDLLDKFGKADADCGFQYLVHCGVYDGLERPVDAKIISVIPVTADELEKHLGSVRTPFPADAGKPNERLVMYLEGSHDEGSLYHDKSTVEKMLFETIDEIHEQGSEGKLRDCSNKHSTGKLKQTKVTAATTAAATTTDLYGGDQSWEGFLMNHAFANTAIYPDRDFNTCVKQVAQEAACLLKDPPSPIEIARVERIFKGRAASDVKAREILGYLLVDSDLDAAICKFPYQIDIKTEEEALLRLNWLMGTNHLATESNLLSELNRVSANKALTCAAATLFTNKKLLMNEDLLTTTILPYFFGYGTTDETVVKARYGELFKDFIFRANSASSRPISVTRINEIVPGRLQLAEMVKSAKDLEAEVSYILESSLAQANNVWLSLLEARTAKPTGLSFRTHLASMLSKFIFNDRALRARSLADSSALPDIVRTLLNTADSKDSELSAKKELFASFVKFLQKIYPEIKSIDVATIRPDLFNIEMASRYETREQIAGLFNNGHSPSYDPNWLRYLASISNGGIYQTEALSRRPATDLVADFLFHRYGKDSLCDIKALPHRVSILLGAQPKMKTVHGKHTEVDGGDRDLFRDFYSYLRIRSRRTCALYVQRNLAERAKLYGISPETELAAANGSLKTEIRKYAKYVLADPKTLINAKWRDRLNQISGQAIDPETNLTEPILGLIADSLAEDSLALCYSYEGLQKACSILLAGTPCSARSGSPEHSRLLNFYNQVQSKYPALVFTEIMNNFPSLGLNEFINDPESVRSTISGLIPDTTVYPDYLAQLDPEARINLIANYLWEHRTEITPFNSIARLKEVLAVVLGQSRHLGKSPELATRLITGLYAEAKKLKPEIDDLNNYRLSPATISLTDRLDGDLDRADRAVRLYVTHKDPGSINQTWRNSFATAIKANTAAGPAPSSDRDLIASEIAMFISISADCADIRTNDSLFRAAIDLFLGESKVFAGDPMRTKILFNSFIQHLRNKYPSLTNYALHKLFPKLIDLDKEEFKLQLAAVIDGIAAGLDVEPVSTSTPIMDQICRELSCTREEIRQWLSIKPYQARHFMQPVQQFLELVFRGQDARIPKPYLGVTEQNSLGNKATLCINGSTLRLNRLCKEQDSADAQLIDLINFEINPNEPLRPSIIATDLMEIEGPSSTSDLTLGANVSNEIRLKFKIYADDKVEAFVRDTYGGLKIHRALYEYNQSERVWELKEAGESDPTTMA